MSNNAVKNARKDALDNACPNLRKTITDMGYEEIDSVKYIVVQLLAEKHKKNHWIARVETPIRSDYGEPQITQTQAKQSAAYASLLYMIRAHQFGRNFISEQERVSAQQTLSVEEFNKEMQQKRIQKTESRLRSVSVSGDGADEAAKIHAEFEEKSPSKSIPVVKKKKLPVDTDGSNLDHLLKKYAPQEGASGWSSTLERSVSLETGKFMAEAKKIRRNTISQGIF